MTASRNRRVIVQQMAAYRFYVLLGMWGAAFAGYFGPWVGRRSAALAWNAYDLFDLLRLLPEIETGALIVNLQTLRLPLLGLSVLLPLLLAERRWIWRALGGAVGAGWALATLPPYPEIVGAWKTPGWRIPFWWGVGTTVATVALVWLAPKLRYFRPWLMLAWGMLTGIPALVTFNRLLPALGHLHAQPVSPGWGFWLYGVSWALMMLVLWGEGLWMWWEVRGDKKRKAYIRPVGEGAS